MRPAQDVNALPLCCQSNKHTTPMFLSTVAILLLAPALRSLLVTSFSRAMTTPSLHLMPTAVPPFSTALTAYSTYSWCEPRCLVDIAVAETEIYLEVASVR
jgi:hypothetical protein